MGQFRTVLLVALALGVNAAARADDPFEVVIEGGVVELTATIDTVGQTPQTKTLIVPVDDLNRSESLTLSNKFGFGSAQFSIGAQGGNFVGYASASIELDGEVLLPLEEKSFTTITLSARTIEPVQVRLSEDLLAELFCEETGHEKYCFSLGFIPVTGAFQGDWALSGLYEIRFSDEVVINYDEYLEEPETAFLSIELQRSDPQLWFTGNGDLFSQGTHTDVNGDSRSTDAMGVIVGGLFTAEACTSGGLVDGHTQVTGTASADGDGALALTIDGSASATLGFVGEGFCFVGTTASSVEFYLGKRQRFEIEDAGTRGVGITPVTGSINGSEMTQGLYSLSFEISAQAQGNVTSDSSSIEWILWLFEPPCNAADLALPSDMLDFSDVVAFLGAYGASEPSADLGPPFGVWDFSDVVAFLAAFGAGCP